MGLGDYVLLRDDSYKPGSSKVITRHRFTGPIIVQQVVKGRQDAGCTYQLIDERTAKPVKYLVTHDRMKKYDVDRNDFNARLPRINAGKDATANVPGDAMAKSQEAKPDEPRPVEIMRKYRAKGKQYYKARFSDNKTYDCIWVNKALLDHYDCKMKAKNERKRLNDRRNARRR